MLKFEIGYVKNENEERIKCHHNSTNTIDWERTDRQRSSGSRRSYQYFQHQHQVEVEGWTETSLFTGDILFTKYKHFNFLCFVLLSWYLQYNASFANWTKNLI